ncbi:MAG: hypothetical protein CUN48_07795 [Candidatus Thermofonsia Clade 3 bacterium]|uniref:Crp/Fnr family transcriptional regulator n=1 Tax=Candidatus Thermofonsia Clade 3 bacterium TaxID=2364212 RepID=A0A2M8QCR4_9CHLR|nr:MAG: hypothetical protein CUN48_07795 [Candidatus Thermofonsia Clade 3 bacterium]
MQRQARADQVSQVRLDGLFGQSLQSEAVHSVIAVVRGDGCSACPTVCFLMWQTLLQTDLFQGLSPEAMEHVMAAASPPKLLPEGHVLFQQGEPAEACFVLLSGRANLSQLTPNGHETVLRVIEPGQALGLTALLGAGGYSATARVAQPATALAWSGTAIQQLSRSHPLILHNALHIALERYTALQQAYLRLAFETVDHRLAEVLTRLARAQPVQRDGSIVIRESRETLAAMAVTTIFTVSRLLREWERHRIVALKRGMVVIRDLQALRRLAYSESAALP